MFRVIKSTVNLFKTFFNTRPFQPIEKTIQQNERELQLFSEQLHKFNKIPFILK